MNENYDIIIVGGGLVGLTFACAFADSPLKIAVIESHQPQMSWSNENFDARVSAITRASENVFHHLSVWDQIKAERISCYRYMQVWDAKGKGNIRFDSADIGEPSLGYIIENRVMRKALYEKLIQTKNIDFIYPAKGAEIWHVDEGIKLHLQDGRQLTAKLIVGADGARSWMRQQANFELSQREYGHHALVCTVTTELPHQQTARQRFLEGGVLAFLPLSEPNTCSIVWSSLPDKAKQLMAMDDEIFQLSLADAFDFKLGKITNVSERFSFPLTMRHAKNYVKPRIALVGDAAHSIHPLAGQGVNLGFLDAAALAEVVLDAREQQRDIGLLHCLRKYERWRKGENSAMILAMDSFKHLFGTQLAPVIWLRNLGLNLTNKSGPIKYFFVKKAMGLVGDVPKLARALK